MNRLCKCGKQTTLPTFAQPRLLRNHPAAKLNREHSHLPGLNQGGSSKEIRILAERWRVHYNAIRPHSSLGYKLPAPQAWVTNSLGYGEVETATRFPLHHTPDCDEISTKLAALH